MGLIGITKMEKGQHKSNVHLYQLIMVDFSVFLKMFSPFKKSFAVAIFFLYSLFCS